MVAVERAVGEAARSPGVSHVAESADLGRERSLHRGRTAPICLGVALAGIVIWAAIFSVLGVRNHRNFGTWAFDMAIYDQAFWLVSRGGARS